jgi:hypothetical protein
MATRIRYSAGAFVYMHGKRCRNRKLAQDPFSEGLAFPFAFQIESIPVAADNARSPAGRLLDVQPWAEAHG